MLLTVWVYLHSILHSELWKETRFGKLVSYGCSCHLNLIPMQLPICLHCNCVAIFYHFRYKHNGRNLQILYAACIQCPRSGDPIRILPRSIHVDNIFWHNTRVQTDVQTQVQMIRHGALVPRPCINKY